MTSQIIEKKIAEMIRTGEITPETELPAQNERAFGEWAKYLGEQPSSTTVLHRAIKALAKRNLVRIEPRRTVVVGYFGDVSFDQGLNRFWASLAPDETELRQVENWFPSGTWTPGGDAPYRGVDLAEVPEPLRNPEFPNYLKMGAARMARRLASKTARPLRWGIVVQDISDAAPFVRRVLLRDDARYSDGNSLRENLKMASREIAATRNGIRALKIWANSHAPKLRVEAWETLAWLGVPFLVTDKRCLFGHYFLKRSSHEMPAEFRARSATQDDTIRAAFWDEFQSLTRTDYSRVLPEQEDDPVGLGMDLYEALSVRFKTVG